MVREAKMPGPAKCALKMEYEPEVDILTIYFKDPETALSHSGEAEPGVILNYAEDGSLSSVEVLDATRRYSASQLAACSVDEFIDLKKASEISGIAPGHSAGTGRQVAVVGNQAGWAVDNYPGASPTVH